MDPDNLCPKRLINLTYWGQVTHICIGNPTIICSDNGLSPDRRQAITWTNVGILLIGPLGTNFSEILIKIQTFSFKKMHLKTSSAKRRPFCFGLNVLISLSPDLDVFTHQGWVMHINGLVQDCSNSSALAMELLQSCTDPAICVCKQGRYWFRC